METENIKDKIEHWKLLADLFIRKNTKVYIKEINGDLHFCIIILNGEDSVEVENFAPEQRAKKRERIYWLNISDFNEYKERGVGK